MAKDTHLEDTHIEVERKYRRHLTGNYGQDLKRLMAVFNWVNRNHSHYGYLQSADDLDPRVWNSMRRPLKARYGRRRYYWANKDLRGYHEHDRDGRIEIRTDAKADKNTSKIKGWDMDVKVGGPASEERPSLRRDEETQFQKKDNQLSFRGFPPAMRKALKDAFGKPDKLRPVIVLDTQTTVIEYHPKRHPDLKLEIKFDYGIGKNFMGGEEVIMEFEIEIKTRPDDMSDDEMRDLLDQEEQILFAQFDDIERIFDSKPAPLFYDLLARKEEAQDALDRENVGKKKPRKHTTYDKSWKDIRMVGGKANWALVR